jgi:hypothetical protein
MIDQDDKFLCKVNVLKCLAIPNRKQQIPIKFQYLIFKHLPIIQGGYLPFASQANAIHC